MRTVLNTSNIKGANNLLFLGEELGIQRYDKIKYSKFFDLWRKQEEFHWMPEEIGLSKDRADYENLSDTEKFIFNSNLRWQTMTDSMLSRSIHQISQYVTNPELEICMGTWARFENIHSYSYTWILQNITKDPGKFFDSILEDKEIVSRAEQIKNSYDLLLGDSGDIKQKIFDAVLSTQITEGLSFYVSFACSLFFGYRGKMKGNSDIISLIQRDENLHQAITQNIFKYWRENKEEGFQEIVKQNEQKIYDAYGLAAEHEKHWADYLFSQGPLLGLNSEVLKGYIEWLANNRLQSLGYSKIFDRKSNPISGWLDGFMDSSKTQVAPQESEIISYKIGARNTEIKEGEFDGFSL